MNVVLVIAGGTGNRMLQDIPKQFITVNNKPIIIYTLEAFQNHNDIDAIIVSCLKGWETVLEAYAKQYNISKLKWIVEGGASGQESIENGLNELKKHCKGNDIILIHDANRPLISSDVISDSIDTSKEKGFSVAGFSCKETILISEDGKTSDEWIQREKVIRTQTPTTWNLSDFLSAYEEAKKKNITNMSSACNLMIELGRTVNLSLGTEKNFKLTTVEDINMFKAIISEQITDGLKK